MAAVTLHVVVNVVAFSKRACWQVLTEAARCFRHCVCHLIHHGAATCFACIDERLSILAVNEPIHSCWGFNNTSINTEDVELARHNFNCVVLSNICAVNFDVNWVCISFLACFACHFIVNVLHKLVVSKKTSYNCCELWVFIAKFLASVVCSDCCVCFRDGST